MASSDVTFHVEGFDQFQKIDFDKSEIKTAMRKVGRIIRNDARRRVNRSDKSSGYPKKQTGLLRRSIRFKVSRSGFLVRVAPQMVSGMKDFYPAFLYYGVRKSPLKGRERVRARRKGGLKDKPYRIEPHSRNYMQDALDASAREAQDIMFDALRRSFQPGRRTK